jgi:hypothetical protein
MAAAVPHRSQHVQECEVWCTWQRFGYAGENMCSHWKDGVPLRLARQIRVLAWVIPHQSWAAVSSSRSDMSCPACYQAHDGEGFFLP